MKNQENNKKSWAKPEVVVLSVKKETASGASTAGENGQNRNKKLNS